MNSPGPANPKLQPSKVKLRLKKDDIRQCRLCLRVLPKAETMETTTGSRTDQRRKILDAVGVRITPYCKLKSVCANCWLMVDIIYNFRATCRQADTLHGTRLLMMHPGQWLCRENKLVLINCHKLVRKNRDEMRGLFKCSGLDEGDVHLLMEVKKEQEPQPIERVVVMEPKEEKSPQEMLPPTEPAAAMAEEKTEPIIVEMDDERGYHTATDSDPEQTEQCLQMLDAPLEDRQSSRRKNAKDHMCELCGKTMQKTYAETHYNKFHLRSNPYKCSEQGCNQQFPSQIYLNSHVKRVHSEEAQKVEYLECPTCSKKIKGRLHFNYHLTTHEGHGKNPRKEACSVCGKYFYKLYLKDHMFVHTGELPYQCEFCDRKYAARNNWMQHRRKHHADQLQLLEDS
ncbi:zinc finger protein 691-like [Aedes albopictus]|uniref:C2H2-type domain-containing protein n=1 Tax=Aedes albopictus TaxID=7160 RepID=A0ABM1Y0P8_AEDAL|nr:zinc finger protein 691-like [Aedes albopictus]